MSGEVAPLISARPLRPTTLQRSTEPRPVDVSPAEQPADGTATQRDEIVLPSPRGVSPMVPTRSPFSVTRVATQQRDAPMLATQGLADGPRLQRQAQSEPFQGRVAALPLAPVQRAPTEVVPERPEAAGESTSEVAQPGWFDSLSSSEASGLSSRAPSSAETGSGVGAASSAVGAMMGGHHAAETDMDELAGKLYDKIRTRLKSELLVDRERAGFLTDLR